ncbi:Hypothetical protein POVN_LOCUS395 [uncultured virus]|nr:Hypothetical protein POVN_LOCUS395 [uncultured virus]
MSSTRTTLNGYSKGRLSSISDYQTTLIMSGWDWFRGEGVADQIQLIRTGAIGDMSCFYHSVLKAIVSMYQNEADILKYAQKIAAATGDQVNLHSARQVFADNFRRAIAQWFTRPAINPATGVAYTEAEARYYINTRKRGMATILREEIKDPYSVRFNPFDTFVTRQVLNTRGAVSDKKYKWSHNTFEDLISDEEAVREAAFEMLLRDTAGSDDASLKRASDAIKAMVAQMPLGEVHTPEGIAATLRVAAQAAHFTPELLHAKLAEKGITRENILSIQETFKEEVRKTIGEEVPDQWKEYYRVYSRIINDSLAEGKTANEALLACKLLKVGVGGELEPQSMNYLGFITYARGYVEKRRNMVDFIRITFCDPASVSHQAYPMAQQREASDNVERFLVLMGRSINGRTKQYYTPQEIASRLDQDMRVGLIDDRTLLELPLSINYFMLNEGANIYRFNDVDDRGARTFHLNHLIKTVLPITEGGRVVRRCDAGEDDIIPLMPFIMGIDIYLVHLYGDHIRVYRSIFNSPEDSFIHKSPSVVIHSTGGHFEVVGCADAKGVVKTCFEPTHPFIKAINEYTRRLNLGGGHDALYKTLAVSKLKESTPSAYTPLPLPLPGLSIGSHVPEALRAGHQLFSVGPAKLVTIAPVSAASEREIAALMEDMGVDKITAQAIWQAQHSPPKLSALPPVGLPAGLTGGMVKLHPSIAGHAPSSAPKLASLPKLGLQVEEEIHAAAPIYSVQE